MNRSRPAPLSAIIRKAIFKRVDEAIDGAIATVTVVGSTLAEAAVIKLSIIVLIRPFT